MTLAEDGGIGFQIQVGKLFEIGGMELREDRESTGI